MISSRSGNLSTRGSPDSTTSKIMDSFPPQKNNVIEEEMERNTSSSVNYDENESESGSSMYSLKWNTQLVALQKSLVSLWENGIGTDAVLLCQGTSIPAHKIILTAASPYVANVIQKCGVGMMPVIVLDIVPEAGRALLSFLYSGEAHVPVALIPQLVRGAKFLGISGFGDPGVLESLTGVMGPDENIPPPPPPPKTPKEVHKNEGNKLPTMHLPQIPTLHHNVPKFPPSSFLDSLRLRRLSPSPVYSPLSTNAKKGGESSSILDNLLKNPRQGANSYSDTPVNLTNRGNQGRSSPNTKSKDGYIKEDDEEEESIPTQLLEPNVEYHIGSTESLKRNERFMGQFPLPLSLQNPLFDLAKVASAIQSHQEEIDMSENRGNYGLPFMKTECRTRGVKRKKAVTDETVPKVVKPKKAQEAIICQICNKKFSNAYNLRVHMEGHSGQVFVCSVCSHASRSRDALRKHFAYRHRELWVRGMSAFRKGGVQGRKLSISSNNNNNNNLVPNNNLVGGVKSEEIKREIGEGDIGGEGNNNNVSLVDANGNISLNVRGGSDGTLTISEAYPISQ